MMTERASTLVLHKLAPAHTTLLRRSLVLQAALFWLAARLVYIAMAYLATALPIAATGGTTDAHTPVPPPNASLEMWRLWDGWFYESIAQHGYVRPIEATFFPLYPMLVHAVAVVAGGNYLAGQMVVSAAGSFLAYLGVTLLASREHHAPLASLRAFAAFPLAFFLTAFYADGLFIGLCAFALLFARAGAWHRAALCAFLASLTRPLGAALAAPLLWEFACQSRLWTLITAWPPLGWDVLRAALRNRARQLVRAPLALAETASGLLLILLAVPLAYLIFSVYCRVHYGDPLAWQHAQDLFGRVPGWPWQSLGLTFQQVLQAPPASVAQTRVLLDLLPVLLVLGLTVWSIRRQPASFTLLSLGVLWLSLSQPEVYVIFPDAIAASGRHMLAAIPAYLMLGQIVSRRPWLEFLVCGIGVAVQAFCVTYIYNGGWII